jgi:hypothetical protein
MRTWILILSLLTLSLGASAQGKGKGKGHAGKSGGSSVRVSVVFSANDRGVIQQWAQALPPNGLPPGLQKKGLPPGLQKQLQRNGTLPPGLQKRITPFPADLLVQVTPPPAGCNYVFLGGQALIVARAGNIIVDVMALF